MAYPRALQFYLVATPLSLIPKGKLRLITLLAKTAEAAANRFHATGWCNGGRGPVDRNIAIFHRSADPLIGWFFGVWLDRWETPRAVVVRHADGREHAWPVIGVKWWHWKLVATFAAAVEVRIGAVNA